MFDTLIIVVVLLLALSGLALVIARAFAGRAGTIPVTAKRLMTEPERQMITIIEGALPACRVHAQVAMSALLDCRKEVSRDRRVSVRNRFDRKIVDFVVEDRATGDVLCLIELDDRTHNAERDRARDAITSAAGYRTIRFQGGGRLDAAEVRKAIVAKLAETTLARQGATRLR